MINLYSILCCVRNACIPLDCKVQESSTLLLLYCTVLHSTLPPLHFTPLYPIPFYSTHSFPPLTRSLIIQSVRAPLSPPQSSDLVFICAYIYIPTHLVPTYLLDVSCLFVFRLSRYYILAIVFGLCLLVVIWKLMYKRQTSLLSLARRTLFTRTHQEQLEQQETHLEEPSVNEAFNWQESFGEENEKEAERRSM